VVGRRGENFGVEKRWKKKKIWAGRMGFSFIRKTASTGSSATGALVAANSLQPTCNGCGRLRSRLLVTGFGVLVLLLVWSVALVM
jgi:hypothetical protein